MVAKLAAAHSFSASAKSYYQAALSALTIGERGSVLAMEVVTAASGRTQRVQQGSRPEGADPEVPRSTVNPAARHDPEGLGLSVMSTEVLFPQTSQPSRLARIALSRTPLVQALWLVLAGAALVCGAVLTYVTGGTMHAYLHLMYLPIGIAAFRLGAVGGLVAAALAGLLIGPFMPLDTATGEAQSTSSWLFRMALFMVNGGVLGVAAQALNQRLERAISLRARLGKVHARSLKLFARLVAERDEPTAGHCERVARNAVTIGRQLGLPRSDLPGLYWAGMLHDLGKIGVPELILHKPGRLSSEEFAVMKRHARLGYEVLMSVTRSFEAIADGVYSHHERVDGTGYPRGLKGDDIPLFGRIVAVADVFEAVTSERPYRHPMAVEEAVELVLGGSGTQFDAEVVAAFVHAHDAGLITWQQDAQAIYDSSIESIVAQTEHRLVQTKGT